MPARDFDKALQEKVQQLRLDPSPDVWAGVAQELNRKRRRRGAAWIFTAAAVLTGITLLLIGNLQEKDKSGKEILSKSGTIQNEVPGITNPAPGQTSITTNNDQLNFKTIDQNFTLPNASVSDNKKSSLSTATHDKPSELVSAGKLLNKSQAGREVVMIYKPSARKHDYPEIYKQKKYTTGGGNSGKADSHGTLGQESDMLSRSLVYTVIAGPSEASSPLVTTPPERKAGNKISPALITATKLSKQDKWHTAILFGAGASVLVESGLQQYNTLDNDYLSQVAIPAGIATIQQRPSDVKAGPSFYIGAQITRSISKKWSAGVGIQYAYLSNRITVGTTPDSAIVLYTARRELISTNVPYKASGNSGNNFYNQFHFIQMPLDMYLSIGAKQKWDYHAGLNIGYLVGINALQYNNQAGVYYRDNDNYRKWQAAIQMGFHYTFPDVMKLPLQVGPFAQYQLTSLDKTTSNKHLLNFGLEARLQIN